MDFSQGARGITLEDLKEDEACISQLCEASVTNSLTSLKTQQFALHSCYLFVAAGGWSLPHVSSLSFSYPAVTPNASAWTWHRSPSLMCHYKVAMSVAWGRAVLPWKLLQSHGHGRG